jgi:hypothetical protein
MLVDTHKTQCDDKMTMKFEWLIKGCEFKLWEKTTIQYMHNMQGNKKPTWPTTDMTNITEETCTWQTVTKNQKCPKNDNFVTEWMWHLGDYLFRLSHTRHNIMTNNCKLWVTIHGIWRKTDSMEDCNMRKEIDAEYAGSQDTNLAWQTWLWHYSSNMVLTTLTT